MRLGIDEYNSNFEVEHNSRTLSATTLTTNGEIGLISKRSDDSQCVRIAVESDVM